MALEEVEEFFDTVDSSPENQSDPPSCLSPPLLSNSQVVITMCASNTSTKHNTFKIQGQIDNITVFAMIDNDSTHYFVSPSIVTLSLSTTQSDPLTVITANGIRLSTNLLCEHFQFGH
jgi:hypothetical protein